jgi:hypothetical protein
MYRRAVPSIARWIVCQFGYSQLANLTPLTTSQTDPAGLVTKIGYNAVLQPSSFALPTGATSQTIVDFVWSNTGRGQA